MGMYLAKVWSMGNPTEQRPSFFANIIQRKQTNKKIKKEEGPLS
jgi:hypothetical protein